MVVVKRRSLLHDLGPAAMLSAVLVLAWTLVLLVGSRAVNASSSRSVFDAVSAVVPVVGRAMVVWVLLGAALMLVGSLRRGIGISPVGTETPDGERWVVESLAARTAADGPAAFMLAVRTLRSFPSGRVLVAVARTPTLQNGYVRLGFERGDQGRVFKRT